jgi:mono/diheme cytochrome c family protein
MSRVLWSLMLLAVPVTLQAQEGRPQVNPEPNQTRSQRNDELQPDSLPALPSGLTLDLIRQGDSVFHHQGVCFACHGSEGEGLPAAGDAITVSLSYVQPEWQAIDSLITTGIPDALTRSPIAMPARGARSDLSDKQLSAVAAYVWAIAHARGEPWPGGHPNHLSMIPRGSTTGTAGRGP